jgi:hypothetical protein
LLTCRRSQLPESPVKIGASAARFGDDGPACFDIRAQVRPFGRSKLRGALAVKEENRRPVQIEHGRVPGINRLPRQKVLPVAGDDPDKSADRQRHAAIAQTLVRWQADSDLAGVRELKAIDSRSEPERAGWHTLWKDVAAALARARGGIMK